MQARTAAIVSMIDSLVTTNSFAAQHSKETPLGEMRFLDHLISWPDFQCSRQPGAEQPTGRRSQNQADDDEGQCHREFVPTALPRCCPAGQSGHAGHGVRWMAGDCLSAKANSPPTRGR